MMQKKEPPKNGALQGGGVLVHLVSSVGLRKPMEEGFIELFIRFSSVLLVIVLIGSFGGKILFDWVVDSFAVMCDFSVFFTAMISYGTFITLTAGFLRYSIWVFILLVCLSWT
jgi:hypothetical protein